MDYNHGIYDDVGKFIDFKKVQFFSILWFFWLFFFFFFFLHLFEKLKFFFGRKKKKQQRNDGVNSDENGICANK